ncbi:hypothetical protein TNCT_18701 [Trichonephila clavata]|uniref:Uncharacterized protein n=1 Tax=Trichonephila clavata TaxID=2740835 RepID=A0A8X6GKW1_TRICU|nr:hypothetical protein TNCT_18701 [Trichonephila clavata]
MLSMTCFLPYRRTTLNPVYTNRTSTFSLLAAPTGYMPSKGTAIRSGPLHGSSNQDTESVPSATRLKPDQQRLSPEANFYQEQQRQLLSKPRKRTRYRIKWWSYMMTKAKITMSSPIKVHGVIQIFQKYQKCTISFLIGYAGESLF